MLAARRLMVCCVAAACAAQSGLPPEMLQLSRIKLLMKEHLLRIANAPDRTHTGRMTKRDTLRLEVAFVDGKFEESNIAAEGAETRNCLHSR